MADMVDADVARAQEEALIDDIVKRDAVIAKQAAELALLRTVADAAQAFREAGDRNYYRGMGTIHGSDPSAASEMRVAYRALCDALDAFRKEHGDG